MNFQKRKSKILLMNAENKNYQIIMTEKDYFKIKDFKLRNINYLKVKLEIEKKKIY